MRFVFVDRIVAVEPSRRIETLKTVSGLEDVFADHFPGYPVLPGALVVEAFAQASQLLIAVSRDFAEVGRLRGLSRVAFRHPVRPGDRLAIRCERRAAHGDARVHARGGGAGHRRQTVRRAAPRARARAPAGARGDRDQ